jgi:hypothetical protein
MYSSPSTRISRGSFRCARRTRRYSGIGGNRANGTDLPGDELVVASNLWKARILVLLNEYFNEWNWQNYRVLEVDESR